MNYFSPVADDYHKANVLVWIPRALMLAVAVAVASAPPVPAVGDSAAPSEAAGCIPFPPDSCAQFTALPGDFSFTTGNPYWRVIGVIPGDTDDKDIRAYSTCAAGGALLAASVGFQGADFVVGDFNHTQAGTFFARVDYGDPSAAYQYYADGGSEADRAVFPLDEVVSAEVGVGAVDCGIFRIWDVYLEADETYAIGFTSSGAAEVRLALFFNPGSGDYWTSRYGSVWELTESGNATYTAPETDWYGLVAFANHKARSGSYTIRMTPGAQATGLHDEPTAPERFALLQNAPNPFNPSTSIRFDVPSGGARVRLQIFDVAGRLVRTIVDGEVPAGRRTVTWFGENDSGRPVSGGVYFCRLAASGYAETRKMVLLK